MKKDKGETFSLSFVLFVDWDQPLAWDTKFPCQERLNFNSSFTGMALIVNFDVILPLCLTS